MTKRDFEMVATVLASLESELEEMPDPSGGEDKATALATLRLTVDKLAVAFKQNSPRFDTGRFQTWAMPIRSARLKAEILRKLET